MFDEAHQPRLADLVEKGLEVAIEHPVDAPPADPERERIQQCTVLAQARRRASGMEIIVTARGQRKLPS